MPGTLVPHAEMAVGCLVLRLNAAYARWTRQWPNPFHYLSGIARKPSSCAKTGLEWSQVDFNGATLHVRRAKNGKAATHPIRGDEMRALRKLQREAPKSPFVFVNERGAPFSPDGFNWLVKRTGQKAGLPFQVHAHMLRHSAGYKLAGDGHDTRAIQDYLGHRNISNTVRYTELSPTRFKNFWRD
jgi:integrase